MISFYKPTPKVTGTALSFYLNKRDNAFFQNYSSKLLGMLALEGQIFFQTKK